MTRTKRAAAMIWTGLIITSVAGSAGAQDKLPPTEILHLMFHEMATHPDAQRTSLTVPLMKRTETEDLSERERFALGEVYFTNLQPVESKAAFEPFMSGTDARAAMAWERVMQILFRAEGKADEVERMLPKYQERFPPSPDNVFGATSQVQNVARLYRDKGEHDKVVELIEREVSRLSFDAPYRSWILPGVFLDSYAATGRADTANEHLRGAYAHFNGELKRHPAPATDFRELDHVDGVLHRIEDHFYGSLAESDDPDELRALRTKSLVRALEEHMANRP